MEIITSNNTDTRRTLPTNIPHPIGILLYAAGALLNTDGLCLLLYEDEENYSKVIQLVYLIYLSIAECAYCLVMALYYIGIARDLVAFRRYALIVAAGGIHLWRIMIIVFLHLHQLLIARRHNRQVWSKKIAHIAANAAVMLSVFVILVLLRILETFEKTTMALTLYFYPTTEFLFFLFILVCYSSIFCKVSSDHEDDQSSEKSSNAARYIRRMRIANPCDIVMTDMMEEGRQRKLKDFSVDGKVEVGRFAVTDEENDLPSTSSRTNSKQLESPVIKDTTTWESEQGILVPALLMIAFLCLSMVPHQIHFYCHLTETQVNLAIYILLDVLDSLSPCADALIYVLCQKQARKSIMRKLRLVNQYIRTNAIAPIDPPIRKNQFDCPHREPPIHEKQSDRPHREAPIHENQLSPPSRATDTLETINRSD